MALDIYKYGKANEQSNTAELESTYQRAYPFSGSFGEY
jgi:hypothetical protein